MKWLERPLWKVLFIIAAALGAWVFIWSLIGILVGLVATAWAWL